ncbi:MAG: hypothetical protein UZ01_02027 [Candidatus Brocadia sinica]|nr:MAG: hypothetical protein UZ01_02027 [Candidatus Brocadia sinica]
MRYGCAGILQRNGDMIVNKKRNRLFFALLSVCVVYNGIHGVCCGEPKRKDVLPIHVAGMELEVEVAITPEDHMLGLMYRDTLEDNEGMLFIFPKEEILSFWMKDTRIPLSIAFIKANGRIVQIESMKPHSLDTHVSEEKVKYALEMKEGWFKAHKVKVGDTVKIPITAKEKKTAGRD